jgi:hypothetical protein
MIAVSNIIVICQESGHVNSECQRNLFAFQLIGAGYTFFSNDCNWPEADAHNMEIPVK